MINNLIKRIKMYVMISAIENDFIQNLVNKLDDTCLNDSILQKANSNKANSSFEGILRALDIQSFIDILNLNIIKLNISKNEKNFINNDLSKIINIRNKIMHPRLLEFYDFTILSECFSKINEMLPDFTWNNVLNAKENILNNNEELLKLEDNINFKKSSNVIENLPQDVEFEETSFIGRKKEIGEIKEKLFKNNVHILSIVGEGGVGKTSTTIKLLYDLLDDDKNPFNLILWTTLKTKTLNKYEFENIDNSITTTSAMYEDLYRFIGNSKTKPEDIAEYLISISKEFNTLLVLDNLETINSEDIKEFLSKFTENAKVIITSRIGLGEMETRYKLNGLNESDLLEYFDTLLQLYGYSSAFSKEEKLYYAKDILHSNPLAIKWFARSISLKKSITNINDVLAHKDDLIDFCMSNVYDQLSDDAKSLLNTLVVLNKPLTIGELFYFMEAENGNELNIRKAINDLANSSFIEQSIYNEDSLISISDFAKEFLIKLEKKDTQKLNNKQKELFAFEQDLITDFNTDPYNIKNYIVNSMERHKIISSYYLRKCLVANYKKEIKYSNLYLDLARRISPNFYACNIVSAFINYSTNPQKSIEEYNIALENVKDTQERRMIYIQFARFLLSNNDYNGAIEKLENAELIKKDFYTIFEKVKILACCGKFNEAYNCIGEISYAEIENDRKKRNIYYLRQADIKRREAERTDTRNISKRIDLFKESLSILEQENDPENETLNFIALILLDLFHCSQTKNVMQIIYETIEKYKYNIFKTQNFKLLKNDIRNFKERLPEFDGKHSLLTYIFDINSELKNLSENEAIVSNVKDTFGFVKSSKYPQGIYFSKYDLNFEPEIGDIVQLGEIIEVKQGLTALSISYITNISKKYNF